MDRLQFVAALVEALSWPVAVLALVLLMRKDLSRLAGSVSRIRHEDTEIDFEQGMRDARDAAQRLPDDAMAPAQAREYQAMAPRAVRAIDAA